MTALLHQAPIAPHLVRKKGIACFILGLINSRKVKFQAVAQHLNYGVKISSNEKRVEDFFRDVSLNYLAFVTLFVDLLPMKCKCRLCIDRTEWNFGKCEVNVVTGVTR